MYKMLAYILTSFAGMIISPMSTFFFYTPKAPHELNHRKK